MGKGWKVSTYAAHENGQNEFDPATAREYAKAFGFEPLWLLLGEGPRKPQPKGLGPIYSLDEFEAQSMPFIKGEVSEERLRADQLRRVDGSLSLAKVDGRVQAGAWLEVDIVEEDGHGEVVSAPRDPLFPYARQVAYRVGGDSMNQADRPIRDGDFVVCAWFEDTGFSLEDLDGEIVIVQQTIADGQLRERSIKVFCDFPDRVEYQPRSDNPAHKAIVVPKDADPADARRVEVIALHRFTFEGRPRPLKKRR